MPELRRAEDAAPCLRFVRLLPRPRGRRSAGRLSRPQSRTIGLSDRLTIALDAMGGDNAPEIVLRGADIARERYPDVRYLIFGDESAIEPLLATLPKLRERAEIRHTTDRITSETKPSAALRTGRQSSMWLAVNAVREGQADAIVSAGNTGALMAVAKFVLRTPKGVDRPAIAGLVPTARGECTMLDLGANLECDTEN